MSKDYKNAEIVLIRDYLLQIAFPFTFYACRTQLLKDQTVNWKRCCLGKRFNSQVFLKDFFSERRIFVSQPILIEIGMKKLFYFTNLLKSGAYGYLDFSCEISNIFRQSQNLRFPFFIPSFALFSTFRKTLSKVCFVVLFFSMYRNRASFWFKNHWNPFIERRERVFQRW